MRVSCSSPTCAATFQFDTGDFGETRRRFREEMEADGWQVQQQPGDPRPSPYCGRCAE